MSYQKLVIDKAVSEAKRVVPELNAFGLPPGYFPMRCPHCSADRFRLAQDDYTGADFLKCTNCNACVEASRNVKSMAENSARPLPNNRPRFVCRGRNDGVSGPIQHSRLSEES